MDSQTNDLHHARRSPRAGSCRRRSSEPPLLFPPAGSGSCNENKGCGPLTPGGAATVRNTAGSGGPRSYSSCNDQANGMPNHLIRPARSCRLDESRPSTKMPDTPEQELGHSTPVRRDTSCRNTDTCAAGADAVTRSRGTGRRTVPHIPGIAPCRWVYPFASEC